MPVKGYLSYYTTHWLCLADRKKKGSYLNEKAKIRPDSKRKGLRQEKFNFRTLETQIIKINNPKIIKINNSVFNSQY